MNVSIEDLLHLEDKYKQRILENASATQAAHAKMQEVDIDREKLEAVELEMNRDHNLMAERISMGVERGHGFDAAKAGNQKTDNPHVYPSTAYLFWYKGWCQGKNIMPFTEVPMGELFELDRPVRQFCQKFKLVNLMESVARRIYEASKDRTVSWEELHPYLKKHYLVSAAVFLEGLTDTRSSSQKKALDPPVLQISGNTR